jgi:hypothetical protein
MVKKTRKFSLALHAGFAAVIVFSVARNAKASYVAYLYQSGPNVAGVGSGTLDTIALLSGGGGNYSAGVIPSFGVEILGQGLVKAFTGLSGPSSFGSGSNSFAPLSSGDVVGVYGGAGALYVPIDYISGTSLSDTAIFNNTTLAALGVTLGTYTWSWGSGPTADSYTLNVSQAPAPEPGTWGLVFASGLALCGYFRARFLRARKHSKNLNR